MEKSYTVKMSDIKKYQIWLIEQEKSQNTIEKYMRDISSFVRFISGCEKKEWVISKLDVIRYKEYLKERYKISSINSMLISINGLLNYMGYKECCVKLLKKQRQIFCKSSHNLTKAEYLRILAAAERRKNERLSLLIETICATGIRVSELQYITVDAVKEGNARINCKGKQRIILIPGKLCRKLKKYAKKNHICSSYIFRTRTGNPLDRSNIWHDMKSLCSEADVEPCKVFPHNLRHLFARTFYGIDKDIARLADILGHSSIETTRIYIISSGEEHARLVEKMGLVV